jgi:ssDNA-binding Zn-finger/Zn-ribbon topoisomerase 1
VELSTYTQCACASCGNVIDYRAGRAGEVITCPKCGVQSVLPEARKLEMIERLGPPIPEIKKCEACKHDLPFSGGECPNCEQSNTSRRTRRRAVAAVSFAGLVVVVAVWVSLAVFHHPKKAAARSYGNSAPGADGLSLPHSGSMLIIEQPKTPAKYGGGLIAGKFFVEQKRGSDLIIAVGEIQNDSEKVHRGLRVDVDLFNRSGVRVGTVSDYMTELAPHQNWHFLSQVQNTNACVARLAQITENN